MPNSAVTINGMTMSAAAARSNSSSRGSVPPVTCADAVTLNDAMTPNTSSDTASMMFASMIAYGRINGCSSKNTQTMDCNTTARYYDHVDTRINKWCPAQRYRYHTVSNDWMNVAVTTNKKRRKYCMHSPHMTIKPSSS